MTAAPGAPATARVDVWTWAVRLFRTRSEATAACRGGRVRVNGQRAKAAAPVRVGDDVRVMRSGEERHVTVGRVVVKRVGATVAAACLTDLAPPPAPRQERPAAAALRDRGAGRPTKRDRRELERLRGRG